MSNSVSNDFREHGGSYLISNNNYEDYIQGRDIIGRPDGQFMIPSNQMDDLINNYPNDPREWERQLGLDRNSLGDTDIHRVDVYNPDNYEPRLPSSELSGSNDKYIDGGKVPGGQDECVINPFPNPEHNPEIGKVSTLNTPEQTQADNNSNHNISSQNIESVGGGGARAPDVERGQLPQESPPSKSEPHIAGEPPKTEPPDTSKTRISDGTRGTEPLQNDITGLESDENQTKSGVGEGKSMVENASDTTGQTLADKSKDCIDNAANKTKDGINAGTGIT